MHPRVRYVLVLLAMLAGVEAATFLYPPWIESVIPNYYIHYEVWIPLAIGLHAYWTYWALTRWRRLRGPLGGAVLASGDAVGRHP